MVVARAKASPASGGAGAGGARRSGVRVGPARLEGLPAAWWPGAAAVKVKWPAPGGALSQMLTGRWARGVTAVEPVGAGGTVRWEAHDGNRFRLDVDPAGAGARGRPERGVFFSVLYGFQEQGRGKDLVRLEEIGTAMISLEECCWEMQLQQQRQQLVVVPIRVRKDGWASDAMLYDDDPSGSWETREFTSRDAETKLRTPVFFASIDQRDDSAGGESACTALVA
ncbi:hypothetical protein BAE44_0002267, partial [Dichanthelium oligosanthes]